MTEILLNTICNDMHKYLNNYPLEKLKNVLKYNLFILNKNNKKKEIDYFENDIYGKINDRNERVLKMAFMVK